MKLIKLLVAGPRDFTDYIRIQQQKYINTRIVNETTEPSTTVEVLETRAAGVDAVLLGFDDDNVALLADVITRNQIKAVVFVSAQNPAAAYKKWARHRIKIATAGSELSTIERFFQSKAAVSRGVNQQNDLTNSNQESEMLRARVDIIREREDKNKVVAVDKKTITIFGQKGGIGKSTITVSLAKSIATLTNMRGVILDLDFNRDYGDVIRYFGIIGPEKSNIIEIDEKVFDTYRKTRIPAEKTLSAWSKFPWELRHDRHLVDSCLVQVPNHKNLFVLPPVRTIMDAKEVTYELVQKVIEVLKRHFSFVLVDGGNTLSNATLSAMEASDEIIILSSAELCVLDSLADFTTSTINMIQGSPIISLCINEVPKDYPYKLEKELPNITKGYPVVVIFPYDEGVFKMLSCNATVPYLGCHDLPFTKEMEKLMYHIFPKEAFRQNKNTASSGGLFKIFKKIVNR